MRAMMIVGLVGYLAALALAGCGRSGLVGGASDAGAVALCPDVGDRVLVLDQTCGGLQTAGGRKCQVCSHLSACGFANVEEGYCVDRDLGCADPACGPAPAVAPPPATYIRWSMTAPAPSSGASATGAGPDLWSVAPEGGDVYGLTFKLTGGVGLRFEAPRYAIRLGTTTDIDGVTSSLAAWFDSSGGGCFTWSGSYRIDADLPRWSISIDAVCLDNGLAVAGSWSGDGG